MTSHAATAFPAAPPPRELRPAHERIGYLPVRLHRQATPPAGLRYALTSFWEERWPGRVQRTTIEKSLTLHYAPDATGGGRLTYRADPPKLCKPDLTALETILLLLAPLYQHLELTVAPTGQLLALHNHEAIRRTWAAIRPELLRRAGGGEDEFTQLLLASVEAQLQVPAQLLASLAFDYAFAFLLPDCYGQLLEGDYYYPRARELPKFFADSALCLHERLALQPAAVGRVALQSRGTLDAARTNLAAVARQVDAARQAVDATAPTTDPATLRADYEATYQLDAATGWPLLLDASVRCYAAATYSKEYFLRLEQLPPL